jgi:hypothetical protein
MTVQKTVALWVVLVGLIGGVESASAQYADSTNVSRKPGLISFQEVNRQAAQEDPAIASGECVVVQKSGRDGKPKFVKACMGFGLVAMRVPIPHAKIVAIVAFGAAGTYIVVTNPELRAAVGNLFSAIREGINSLRPSQKVAWGPLLGTTSAGLVLHVVDDVDGEDDIAEPEDEEGILEQDEPTEEDLKEIEAEEGVSEEELARIERIGRQKAAEEGARSPLGRWRPDHDLPQHIKNILKAQRKAPKD